MQLQQISPYQSASQWQAMPAFENPAQALSQNSQKNLSPNASKNVHLNATLEAEYLTDQKFAVELTSKDGDKVSFSMESIQYQKTLLRVDAEGSPDDMKKITDYIMSEYAKMKDDLLKKFVEALGGTIGENQPVSDTKEVDAAEELKIPDYWNAENTSQRIVDFATSFFDSFKGAGEDFLKIIKDAIENGFKEAKDFLGALPDSIQKLVDDTHDQVMQKLDKWAEGKGIKVDTPDEQGKEGPMESAAKAAA